MNYQIKKSVFVITIALALSLISFTQAATYGGGSGTAEDPYQIWTPQEMNTIGLNSGDWGSHFKLMTDIDMSIYTGTQYKIIGNSTTYFTGTFDGNGHVIRNLTYTTTEAVNYVGVFGYASNAIIKNLAIENVNLSAKASYSGELYYIGGLVGYQSYSTITNCYITGSVTFSSPSSFSFAGGLAGYQYFGTISNCYNTGSVTASSSSSSPSSAAQAGGLVGQLAYGILTNCYNAGSVAALTPLSEAGGLVAQEMFATIINCYNTGLVTASSPSSSHSCAGGLVGYPWYGTITSSYSTGVVTSSSSSYDIGGLAGYNPQSTMNGCFWDTQNSGLSNGVGRGDSSGAAGKTTIEMKTLSTFTLADWDFIETWSIEDNQTYPFLKLTYPTGDIDLNKQVDLLDLVLLSKHWLEGTGI
ncbi:MAG: GLUG motif-containing protein [Anaerohalosphaeraceae bacterium]